MKDPFLKVIFLFILFIVFSCIAFSFILRNKINTVMNSNEQVALSYIKQKLNDKVSEKTDQKIDKTIFKAEKIAEARNKIFFDDYFSLLNREVIKTQVKISANENYISITSKSRINLLVKIFETNTETKTFELEKIDSSLYIDISCNGSCGACGKCDVELGFCVPDYTAAFSKIGSMNHPEPVLKNGKYECDEFCNTSTGKECLKQKGEVVISNGRMACKKNKEIEGQKYECMYADNFYAWNKYREKNMVHWGSKTPTAVLSVGETEFTDKNGNEYIKDEAIQDGFNKYKLNAFIFNVENLPYAICKKIKTETKVWSGKRVFVTSTSYTGNFVEEAKNNLGLDFTDDISNIGPGIKAADELCKSRAAAAKLGGRWLALISDSKSNARDRLKSEQKLYLTDKKTLANSKSIWDGSPDRFISLDEFGSFQTPGRQVWTGTDVSGFSQSRSPFVHCEDWTTTEGTGRAGLVSSRQVNEYFNWIAYGAGANCAEPRALYCFEI